MCPMEEAYGIIKGIPASGEAMGKNMPGAL
jgi:hypothetical protein